MKKTIIFNWKMNPSSLKEATSLFKQTRTYAPTRQRVRSQAKSGGEQARNSAEIIIAAPFVYLPFMSSVVGHKSLVKLAAQNVFYETSGAYTGEISPEMLKNSKVEYVIIGHSERRQNLGETDEMINKKVLTALNAGLKVILCVGEHLNIHKKGKKDVQDFFK